MTTIENKAASEEVEGAAEEAVVAEDATGDTPEELVSEVEPGVPWFAVHTYSSYENKVKQMIEHRATLEGMREVIQQVVIPTEKVIEIKGGKKRTIERTLMPGYIIVQMDATEEAFNLVRSVKGVSSFVGEGNSPAPLGADEVSNLLDIMEDKHEKPKAQIDFEQGDQVKVIEGPFATFVGSVEEIDEEKGKLKVMVSIFGRLTPVELDVLQVEGI